MENASKALFIAGGMLFAIIVISLFALEYSNITMMKQAEIEKEMQNDVAKFNKPFLAFNKKAMYGTDIVSIMNFAISSNMTYEAKPGEDYYVNISFKLTEDAVQDRIFRFKLTDTGRYTMYDAGTDDLNREFYREEDSEFKTVVTKFVVNKEYSLQENFNELESFLMTADYKEETKVIPPDYSQDKIPRVYYIKYSGMADFKRKTFKCSEVILDKEDGRVLELKFEQIVKSTYGTYE